MTAKTPTQEAARLAALEQYNILDTPPEQSYDDITALAAYICDVPIALISLVDADRQWFKSKVGIDFTHGVCDRCMQHHFPDVAKVLLKDEAEYDVNSESIG
jgi:hypothetical protein